MPVIKKIWPKFSRIVSAGTGEFEIYTEQVKRYTGDDIEFFNAYYAASEGMIGRAMGKNTDEFILLTDRNYFEFREITEDETAPLIKAEELIPGADYEIFITNNVGLYRYRMGDIIHVERMKDDLPVFKHRRKYYETCSVNDVTVTINDIYDVIRHMSEQATIKIRDYCIEADEDNNCFDILIELPPSRNYMSYVSEIDTDTLSQSAEQKLVQLSESYAEARRLFKLAPLRVRILDSETQLLYRDKTMQKWNCMADQRKPVRILDTDEKKNFFHNFIVK